MLQRIGIIVFFLGCFSLVKAQKPLSISDVDIRSYQLFQEKKWDELLKFASEARAQGIDFFYLQARTGIALYNLKKYRKATDWFFKAWKNDKNFDWLQEYLYYSLIFSGRILEGAKISAQFPDQMKAKLKVSPSGLKHLGFEGGYSYNPEFQHLKQKAFAEKVKLGENYGEASLLRNYFFQSVELSHRISPVTFYHNLTYIDVSREANVDWIEHTKSPVKTRQYQYFFNPQFLIYKNIYVSPSINILYGNADIYAGRLDLSQNRIYRTSKLNFTDLIFSASTGFHSGNISPGAEINFGDINNNRFNQYSLWLTWYPFSNTDFYFTPRVYFKSEPKLSQFEYIVSGLTCGWRMGPVYFSGQFLSGKMENFIESGGYVVANFPGKSDRKISGSLYFPVGKKYQFVVRYLNQEITETYQVYTNGVKSNALDYKFAKHTFTGGLSWFF